MQMTVIRFKVVKVNIETDEEVIVFKGVESEGNAHILASNAIQLSENEKTKVLPYAYIVDAEDFVNNLIKRYSATPGGGNHVRAR